MNTLPEFATFLPSLSGHGNYYQSTTSVKDAVRIPCTIMRLILLFVLFNIIVHVHIIVYHYLLCLKKIAAYLRKNVRIWKFT